MGEEDRWRDECAALATEVERVAGRLRGLGEPRLRVDLPPWGSVADAGHAVAQALADAASGVEDRSAARAPARREVPRLRSTSVGDQVAVTGQDLVEALAAVSPDTEVWSPDGSRTTASDVRAAAYERVHTAKLAIN